MGSRIISTPMLLSMAKSVSSYLLRLGSSPVHASKKVVISMPFVKGSLVWQKIEEVRKRRAAITKSFLPPHSICSIFHISSNMVVCIKRLYTLFSEKRKSFKFAQSSFRSSFIYEQSTICEKCRFCGAKPAA